MKLFTKKDKRTGLEKLIDKYEEKLSTLEMDSDDYEQVMEGYRKLFELKEKQDKCKNNLSMDTIAVIVGNLAGIMLVLNFERMGVITSKALGFIIKGRV